jgi:hypothetical protein
MTSILDRDRKWTLIWFVLLVSAGRRRRRRHASGSNREDSHPSPALAQGIQSVLEPEARDSSARRDKRAAAALSHTEAGNVRSAAARRGCTLVAFISSCTARRQPKRSVRRLDDHLLHLRQPHGSVHPLHIERPANLEHQFSIKQRPSTPAVTAPRSTLPMRRQAACAACADTSGERLFRTASIPPSRGQLAAALWAVCSSPPGSAAPTLAARPHQHAQYSLRFGFP